MKVLTRTMILESVVGVINEGFLVLRARNMIDSDVYGIALAQSQKSGQFVTWQFHFCDDGSLSFYWGHYWGNDNEKALEDFNNRIE